MFEINQLTGRVAIRTKKEIQQIAKATKGNYEITGQGITEIQVSVQGIYTVYPFINNERSNFLTRIFFSLDGGHNLSGGETVTFQIIKILEKLGRVIPEGKSYIHLQHCIPLDVNIKMFFYLEGCSIYELPQNYILSKDHPDVLLELDRNDTAKIIVAKFIEASPIWG